MFVSTASANRMSNNLPPLAQGSTATHPGRKPRLILKHPDVDGSSVSQAGAMAGEDTDSEESDWCEEEEDPDFPTSHQPDPCSPAVRAPRPSPGHAHVGTTTHSSTRVDARTHASHQDGEARDEDDPTGSAASAAASTPTRQSGSSPPDPSLLVSPTSLLERMCIQRFGISYDEVMIKLVTDGVVSDAEARVMRLALTRGEQSEPHTALVDAVLRIEEEGVCKESILAFRKQLRRLVALVAKAPDLVRALARQDVFLARPAGEEGQAEYTSVVSGCGPGMRTGDSQAPGAPLTPHHVVHVPEDPACAHDTTREGVERNDQGRKDAALQGRRDPAQPTTETGGPRRSFTAFWPDAGAPSSPDRVFGVIAECQEMGLPHLSPSGLVVSSSDHGPGRGEAADGEVEEGATPGQPGVTLAVGDTHVGAGLQTGGSTSHHTLSPSRSDLSVASPSLATIKTFVSNRDLHTKPFQRVPVIDQVLVKVAQRIAEVPRAQLLGRTQVVLVGSGAYNPIHKRHLRMFYIARKYLEEHTEFGVLGGLVSPAHATEVRSRCRQRPKEIIPPKHRLAMARAAVGESSWITVDPWEITRRRVMDYLSVLEHVQQLFLMCFPELPIKLIYLCGSDGLVQLSPEDLRDRNLSCLCICRPQETDRVLKRMGSRWKNVAYVVEDAAILSQELESLNSSKVRQMAMKHGNVEAMVGSTVSRYMKKYALGAKMSGKERWTAEDRHFELDKGISHEDRGYVKEPKRPKRPSQIPSQDPSVMKHTHPFELL